MAKKRKTANFKPPTPEYEALMEMAHASLPEGSQWCVVDPDGKVIAVSVQDRPDESIVAFCTACECDWDEATEQDFRLTTCRPARPIQERG